MLQGKKVCKTASSAPPNIGGWLLLPNNDGGSGWHLDGLSHSQLHPLSQKSPASTNNLGEELSTWWHTEEKKKKTRCGNPVQVDGCRCRVQLVFVLFRRHHRRRREQQRQPRGQQRRRRLRITRVQVSNVQKVIILGGGGLIYALPGLPGPQQSPKNSLGSTE